MTSSVQFSFAESVQSGAWTGSRSDSCAGTVRLNGIVGELPRDAFSPGSVISKDSSTDWSELRFVTLTSAAAQSCSGTHVWGRADEVAASFETSCVTNISGLIVLVAARRRL